MICRHYQPSLINSLLRAGGLKAKAGSGLIGHWYLVGGRADVVAPDALRALPAGPHRRQRRHGPAPEAVELRHGGGHGSGGGELGGHGDACAAALLPELNVRYFRSGVS